MALEEDPYTMAFAPRERTACHPFAS
jgi:hypothetical protein